MREIRKSGLEGGAGQNPAPTLAGNLRFSLVGHDRRACRVTTEVSLVAIRYIEALSLGVRDTFCLEDAEWRSSDCPAVNPYRQPSVAV